MKVCSDVSNWQQLSTLVQVMVWQRAVPYLMKTKCPMHKCTIRSQWTTNKQEIQRLFAKLQHIDGLVQERCNSSSLAMELHLSWTNPSISTIAYWFYFIDIFSMLLALCKGNPLVISLFLSQRASYMKLWCLVLYTPKQNNGVTGVYDAMTLMWRHCNDFCTYSSGIYDVEWNKNNEIYHQVSNIRRTWICN